MKRLLAILAILILIPAAMAAPVTNAVTDITANTATLNAAGGAGEAWFEWGTQSGGYYYYRTINQTASGAYSDTLFGPPYLTGTTYYVRACDVTGCGAEVTWTSSASSIPNRTNFGSDVYSMMKSGMNITRTASFIVKPYTSQLTAPLTYGILFLFIFAGMWIKPKDIFMPCIMGMISGGLLWMSGGIGIDPMFADIGQGLLYAAVAGIIFSWFTR